MMLQNFVIYLSTLTKKVELKKTKIQMKQIILVLFITFSISFAQGQETSSMQYGCYKEFTPTGRQDNGINTGNWGKTLKTDIRVDFGVGNHKDIIVYSNGTKKVYHRMGEPLLGETPSSTKFQLITTKYEGKVYVFQYLANSNLRIIFTDSNKMIEYGCSR